MYSMLVQYFCFCFDLRSSVIGLGYTGMCYSVAMVCIIFFGLADRDAITDHHNELYTLFCVVFILVLFCKCSSDLILVLGALKNGVVELMVWLIVNAVTIVSSALAICLCTVLQSWKLQMGLGICIGLMTCCHAYVWICVHSLYRTNKSKEEDNRNLLDTAAVNV